MQIGVLLGLPGIISGLTEPVLGILGDVWKRRVLVLGGGGDLRALTAAYRFQPDLRLVTVELCALQSRLRRLRQPLTGHTDGRGAPTP